METAVTDRDTAEVDVFPSDLIVHVSTREMLEKFKDIEKFMSSFPDVKFGNDVAPLKHTFGDGIYIRQITMPKGLYVLSKIHKTTHPYFVLQGDVSVVTENGLIRITAPHSGITKCGTQRLLYMHEETVWTTVHATNETDLEKIEDQLSAKTYDELPDTFKEQERLT